MTKRHTPPVRRSYALVVVVKPFGPHNCVRCSGSVQAVHTSSRGASYSRDAMIICGSCARSILFLAATLLLPGLQFPQVNVQSVESFFPEAAVFLEPAIDALECTHLDPAGPPLCISSA